jgi:hypothetical protein
VSGAMPQKVAKKIGEARLEPVSSVKTLGDK